MKSGGTVHRYYLDAAWVVYTADQLRRIYMEPTYTPDKDIYEDYKDGSGRVLVAKAGVPIRWEHARELGLVQGDAPKSDTPAKAARKA